MARTGMVIPGRPDLHALVELAAPEQCRSDTVGAIVERARMVDLRRAVGQYSARGISGRFQTSLHSPLRGSLPGVLPDSVRVCGRTGRFL